MTPNEGHFRVMAHRAEDGKAVYLVLTEAASLWARNWREATSFLTREHANEAAAVARAGDPNGDITVIAQYQDWPRRRATGGPSQPNRGPTA